MKIFENNAKLALANLQTDQLVRTKGGTSAGDGGGRTYRIEAAGASGITLANGNVAVDISSKEQAEGAGNYTNYQAASVADMTNNGNPNGKGVTIKDKTIDYSLGQRWTVSGENDTVVDYQVVNAVSDINLGGGFYGKKLPQKASNIKPSIADSQQSYDDNKPSNMPTLSAKDLIGVYVEVANADAGGSIYTFKKSGNGFVAERLVTGRYSGGDSLPNSCPAWRYGRVDYCQNLAAYKHAYSDSNIGGISGSEVTTAGTIWSGGASILQNGFKLWRVTGAGGYVDFTTSEKDISLCLGSSSDATASLTVQIWSDEITPTMLETHDIKTDITAGTDVFFWKTRNPVGGRPVRVRFVTDSDYAYIGGVNASLDELAYKDVDHIAFYMIQDDDQVFNEGEGAQNYAVKEITTGKFGGESHGGEYMSRRNVYFDNDLQSLVDGTFNVCGRVGVEQRSQVQWDTGNIYMDITSSLTVTSEGSEFCGTFNPVGVIADTAYFAMFTHQGTFNRVRFPKHIDVSIYPDPIQLQTGQGSGFKVMDSKGRIAEASWSEIYNVNPNYQPYLQVKPQNNPYNKYYYGLALPPEGGVTITPFSYCSVRRYSN